MISMHSYNIITFALTFVIVESLDSISLSNPEAYNYKEMEIIDDLPMKTNLEQYVAAMEKMILFVSENKNLADLNLCFGIYLINVNLRRTLQIKGRNLPLRKLARIEQLVQTNDEIMRYFSEMTEKNTQNPNDSEQKDRGLYNLYTNDTTWQNYLHHYNIELIRKTKFFSRKKLESYYFRWPTYVKNVRGIDEESLPNPAQLDNCLLLLAQNPISPMSEIAHCQVPFFCANIVLKGVHYGYAMMHRILFLIAAEFSRRCVISSIPEDQALLDKLCARVYNEAEFIANHDFGVPELIMEQISLCSLEGHSQFLRRSWIDELLDFQTEDGCFNVVRPDGQNTTKKFRDQVTWQFLKSDPMIYGATCHTRTTGIAGAMLASAIRFIIDNYY